jgi:hypothetical protein
MYVYPSYHWKATAQLSVSLHSVLSNNSAYKFPQQRVVGGGVFYAICAVSKDSSSQNFLNNKFMLTY